MNKTIGRVSVKSESGEWVEIGDAVVVTYRALEPDDAHVVVRTKDELQTENEIREEPKRAMSKAADDMFIGALVVKLPLP